MCYAGSQLPDRSQALLHLNTILDFALLGNIPQCDYPLRRFGGNGLGLNFEDLVWGPFHGNLYRQRIYVPA